MDETALANIVVNERMIRFECFLAVFAAIGLWEWLAARRSEKIPRLLRWPHNLALTVVNVIVIRILFPSTVIGAATLASQFQFGIFQQTPVPIELSAFITIFLLDWLIYYLHRAFHALPLLWKIHRVHHTDLEMDVTTGLRFHILELLVSMVLKSLLVLILGAPVFGVFLFEIGLNLSSLFSHSNGRMPDWVDSIIRFLFVTPGMHRIHHSVNPAETNRNFGFIFSYWDLIFGTYTPRPKDSPETMRLGLEVFNEEKYLPVDKLLEQPFLDKDGHFGWKNLTHDER